MVYKSPFSYRELIRHIAAFAALPSDTPLPTDNKEQK